jgi:excisionase family DNA binding protein
VPEIDSENLPENSEAVAPDGLLSVRDVSKMSGYHRDYVTSLARSGKLKAIKLGNNWVFNKGDVQKLMAENMGAEFTSPCCPKQVESKRSASPAGSA